MSQPQLVLGDTPIGAVDEMTTRYPADPIVAFCQTTELYTRRYRVTTIWIPREVPLAGSIIPSGSATYIYHHDESGAETLEYVVPYGEQVTVGGLDEAHHAIVAQMKQSVTASG